MEIVYRADEGQLRLDVAIITRSFLPIAKGRYAGPLVYREALKQRAVVCDENLLDAIGVWSLNRIQQMRNL